MSEFLATAVNEIVRIFYEGSIFILLGFLIAGLLHELLPANAISHHLGRESPRAVVLAALFGAPIPLCSCGVLPAAAALRAKGASRSALTSFLISTPETGVDSVALTYGLMGPVMAVVRPVVAIVTGIVAGLLSIVTSTDTAADGESLPSHSHANAEVPTDTHDGNWRVRARRAASYGFTTLIDEIAFWLIVGIALTGFLAASIPDDFFSTVLGWDRGIVPMLAMLAIGLPLYVCASASTPIAAALVVKGLSPGAALVFLLAGPATNAATIAVVGRLLGARHLRIYLGAIIFTSLAAGLLLDAFAAEAVRSATLVSDPRNDSWPAAAAKTAAAVALAALIVASFRRTRFREGIAEVRDQTKRLAAAVRGFHPRVLLNRTVFGSIGLVLGLTLLPQAALVVGPGERGIVRRLGRVVAADLQPGLHLHLPPPIGSGETVDVDLVRSVTIGYTIGRDGRRESVSDESFYLTADENIIDVHAVVHYRVTDPARFRLGIEAADALIRSLARRELVVTIAGSPIDTIYSTARAQAEERFGDGLARSVTELRLGCEIVDARLLDVHAPADVHDAFRDVASALEDREREILVGTGYAAERTAEASGNASAVLDAARADAQRAIKLSRAEGTAFAGIAHEHLRAPYLTETRLYLEAIESSLASPRKYLQSAPRSGGKFDLWIGAPPAEPQADPAPAEETP